MSAAARRGCRARNRARIGRIACPPCDDRCPLPPCRSEHACGDDGDDVKTGVGAGGQPIGPAPSSLLRTAPRARHLARSRAPCLRASPTDASPRTHADDAASVPHGEPVTINCSTTPPRYTLGAAAGGAGATTAAGAQMPPRTRRCLKRLVVSRAKEAPLSWGRLESRHLQSRTKCADLTGIDPAGSTFLSRALFSNTISCIRGRGHSHRSSDSQGRPFGNERREHRT